MIRVDQRAAGDRSDVVYFVRSGAVVKIGTTDNIRKRFEALCAGSPVCLELVGLIYGGTHVERWCQLRCIGHRSHYDWFRWNHWTEPFVGWLLAHGDEAAAMVCPQHRDADRLTRQKRPAFRGRMPPIPWNRFTRNRERLRDFQSVAEPDAAQLGDCLCRLCAERPWEGWIKQPKSSVPRKTSTMTSTDGEPRPP